MNRICVEIVGIGSVPVNNEQYTVVCGEAKRVGDDVVIKTGDVFTMRDVKVRRLRSKGMVKNADWLVDTYKREAWRMRQA